MVNKTATLPHQLTVMLGSFYVLYFLKEISTKKAKTTFIGHLFLWQLSEFKAFKRSPLVLLTCCMFSPMKRMYTMQNPNCVIQRKMLIKALQHKNLMLV